MIWQDYVIMIGGFIFSIALLPALFSKEKPPRITCFLTGGILAIYVVVFISLELWLSSIATAITSLIWMGLLLQKREE